MPTGAAWATELPPRLSKMDPALTGGLVLQLQQGRGNLAVQRALKLGVPASTRLLQRQRVHMSSGRWVGNVPGAQNNLREDVLAALDALARVGSISQADHSAEYAAVQALAPGSQVPVATIPRTIAAIKENEKPVIDAVSAKTVLGLAAGVGAGQTNSQADVLRLQDILHQYWHLTTPDFTSERAAVTVDPVPIGSISKTLDGLSRLKGAIVAGRFGPDQLQRLKVAGEVAAMTGSKMTWKGSGPGSGTTFEVWASAATEGAAPPVATVTVLNCWEMILLAAFRAKVINWQWIHNLYKAAVGNWGQHLVNTLTKGARLTYIVGDVNSPAPNIGDIVFFEGASHVALGKGERDGAGRTMIWSFWPPPNTAFTAGGTVDEVKLTTIEQLVDYWKANPRLGPLAPPVEFAKPPW